MHYEISKTIYLGDTYYTRLDWLIQYARRKHVLYSVARRARRSSDFQFRVLYIRLL